MYRGDMTALILAQMGGSDCETIGSGVLAQPVNAISSLAYAVVGLFVLAWALRVAGTERIVRVVFGLLMIATGTGSVMFHGTQGPASQFSHDITFLVTVWFLAVLNVAEAYGSKRWVGWSAFGAGAGVLAVSLALYPGITNVLMVGVVVALVGADIALHRRGRIRSGWYVGALVAVITAVAMFILGRTGGLVCDPGSIFQGHALWHLLSAAALGAYFVATSDVRVRAILEG
ncbi:MAG: hypothetical protein BMS9Abin20_1285 [Acidimicrobiia bacterium]|nr:MAG: hypothetical protein BMS9Abin20_1285 [Acidimicrobiia bacterium]